MTVLESRINTSDDAFHCNRDSMQALVDDLHRQVAKVSLGGGDRARERHSATPAQARIGERATQQATTCRHEVERAHQRLHLTSGED